MYYNKSSRTLLRCIRIKEHSEILPKGIDFYGAQSVQCAFVGAWCRQSDRLRSAFSDLGLLSQPCFDGAVYHIQCCRHLDPQLFIR